MSPEVKTEAEDLNLHVRLCAERYRGIQDEFQRLDNRMEKLEGKVDDLQKEITGSHKSLKTVIISTFGSVLVALIGLLGVILMK